MTLRLLTALALALPLTAVPARTEEAVKHYRGVIESVEGNLLTVKPAQGGTYTLRLAAGARIVGAVPAQAADIKPGTYVGVTNEPNADGTASAVEVHIFPEAARGTGEGERPWDKTKTSKMTNGAAGRRISAVDGDKLEITYKGGTSTIILKPGTQIMAYTPGSPADLKPGAHIYVRDAKPAADGVLEATAIVAGKDGFAPAM